MLTLRHRQDAGAHRLELSGELDLANAATFESELDVALRDGDGPVLVDMRGLTFIDSTGIAVLVAAVTRDGGAARLRFVPSSALAVTRVLAVTGVDQRLPLAEQPVPAPTLV